MWCWSQRQHVLTFRAMPDVDYQGQVRSDTHAWSNTGCALRYSEEIIQLPVCNDIVSVPGNGSQISPDGQDVAATITAENANQFRMSRLSVVRLWPTQRRSAVKRRPV